MPFRYTPSRGEGYWHCACGQMNLSSECIKCGYSEETVFEITRTELLTERREARLQEEARIREERKQAIAEKQEALKESAGEVGKKIADGGKAAAQNVGVFYQDTVKPLAFNAARAIKEKVDSLGKKS